MVCDMVFGNDGIGNGIGIGRCMTRQMNQREEQ
jgi:hypothetical protein